MIKLSARNAFATLAYIILVGTLMANGDRLFGPVDVPLLGLVAFLLLFLVSALITGLLVLGKPAALYLDGQRKEGAMLLFYTAGWLIAMTVVAMLALLVIGALA